MVLNKIRKELRENIDLKYKEGAVNFFREKTKIYGARALTVKRIAKKYFREIKNIDKKEIFELCNKLFKSGTNEEETIATDWSFRIKEKYEKEDFKIFESWITRYISNWASCDGFCTHNLGYFIMKNPEFIEELKTWAKSNNRWLRRASAVSLIYCVGRRKNLNESFIISSILMNDKDDLVLKGYGWLLKEASNNFRREVFDYVIKNKNKIPRTALRYAIEKMPEESRIAAMSK